MLKQLARQRIRVRFTKSDDLRFIGHRDLVRTWERMLRRAGLPLSMSEGFRPKPRMNFPSALAVGISGEDEIMELELNEPLAAAAVRAALEPHCVPGLALKSVEMLSPGTPKAQVRRVVFEISIPAERQELLAVRAAELSSRPEAVFDRGAGHKPIHLADSLEAVSLCEQRLRFRMKVNREGTARPREVLAALGADDLEHLGFPLTRIAVELEA